MWIFDSYLQGLRGTLGQRARPRQSQHSLPVFVLPTSYPDGTLLKGSGVNVYVIEKGVRRFIPDERTFNSMGYNWNAIKVIPDSDLSSIPQGTDIA